MSSAIQRVLALAALFVAVVAVPASAQVVTTSAISGLVSDAAGEPLPGANVVAVHVPSGTTYGVATRVDGRFNLPNLRVGGPYTVTASFVGYQAQQVTDLMLALGQELDLTFQLLDASLGGEIVVTADANRLINADRTGAETNVSRSQIERLPTLRRSISDFTRLTPQTTGFNSFGGRNNLYNNLSIDGSLFNNVFGLSSEVGGQTGQQPISLDAVEQISVAVAPYDVRQGSFTGAGINVVTRSGTNEYTGAIYNYYRNQDLVSGTVDGEEVSATRFSERQTGLSIGGPLLRNKAFFFFNGELRDRVDPGATFRPRTAPTETGVDVAEVDQSDLDAIRSLLQSRYDYDPGLTGIYDRDNSGNTATARFDLNLSDQHRLNVRFNYLDSFRDVQPSNSGVQTGTRINNQTAVPFSFTDYTINNDVYSAVAQLNSTIGTGVSNQFTIGYTALRDSRSSGSEPFPFVDILSGTTGRPYTTFGYEQFTPNNVLDTDVFQLTNNTSLYLGDHTVTLGTSNEFYSFANGFTPQFYGRYQFASLEDFLAHAGAADPTAAGVPQPLNYTLTYSAVPGVDVPLAEVSAAQLGLYAQDEWRVRPNFRLTAGLRVDAPVFTSEPETNPTVAALTFAEGETVDTGRLPGFSPLFSPRLGFNYDVLNNREYQLRGGTGIFTGKIPFVWISNQASNNGLLFGTTSVSRSSSAPNTTPLCQPGTSVDAGNCDQIVFDGDVTAFIPETPSAPSSVLINATAEDFTFPQVWRTNLAVDAQLPGGFVGTLEGIYTKDVNAVFHRDANLVAPAGAFDGADERPFFPAAVGGSNRINSNVTNAVVLDNTNQGYQYLLTADLQKTFSSGTLGGLFARLAYTRTVSRDLTSSPSAIALNAFQGNQIVQGPNAPDLGYSLYDQPHRILGVGSYRLDYLGLAGTTVSLTYVGGSGANYSYTYSGDLNGDGTRGNDLLYIPASQDEIVIAPASGDTRTADQIWAALDAFIEQDPYLSEHRGEYAERGGARTPWVNQVDLGLRQEFSVPVGGGRRTRLEVSFDIANFGNFLSSEWGLIRTPTSNSPITFRDYVVERNASGDVTSVTPRFTFGSASSSPTESFRVDTGLASRWQALFGVKLGL